MRFGVVLGGSKFFQIGVWRVAVRVLGASWVILPSSRARPGGVLGASWWWLGLGSQNGAKVDEKSKQKTIKMLMPLRIGILNDFEGLWKLHGGMLASKIKQTSMLASRGVFLKIVSFFVRKKR